MVVVVDDPIHRPPGLTRVGGCPYNTPVRADTRKYSYSCREQGMPDQNDQQPRIIIDDDWKEQARREKEEAERQAQEAAEQHQRIPEPSLLELAQMLVMQVSIGLGGMQDPGTGQMIPPNLALAKHYIDLFEVLKNKTKGNLDENEQKIIDGTLHELRLAFVQVVEEMRNAAGGGPQGPGSVLNP